MRGGLQVNSSGAEARLVVGGVMREIFEAQGKMALFLVHTTRIHTTQKGRRYRGREVVLPIRGAVVYVLLQ